MKKTKKIQTNKNKIIAKARFVRHSPRKLRMVAKAIREIKNPLKAVDMLSCLPHVAAKPLIKLYKQAIANATNNLKLDAAKIEVLNLKVEEGPRGAKKADVHAHGARFDRGIRRKRLAHVILELEGGNHGAKN